MSNTIGKSGLGWASAPEGATHYKEGIFYYNWRGKWKYWDIVWYTSVCPSEYFEDAISKEEDLAAPIKTVSSVEDLEVGMFIRDRQGNIRVIVSDTPLAFCSTSNAIPYCSEVTDTFSNNCMAGWSYTYNGEYAPIVKESEADIKIKELEETIKLAQKQLEEYKGMK